MCVQATAIEPPVTLRRRVAVCGHSVGNLLDRYEAARLIYEADRHAMVTPKKRVRGVRPIERSLEGRDDARAEAPRGYCPEDLNRLEAELRTTAAGRE